MDSFETLQLRKHLLEFDEVPELKTTLSRGNYEHEWFNNAAAVTMVTYIYTHVDISVAQ